MKKKIMTTDEFAGKKILFASFPADGHFNPLTGLAVYLKDLGGDVRWYCSAGYAGKLHRLGITHYPFIKAIDVPGNDFDKAFPERRKKKTKIGKLKFDIVNAFILRGPEYYGDIQDIHRAFPFDIMVADCAFPGIPFVKELMHKPVISIGVLPLTESSKDAPPPGLGLMPPKTIGEKIKQRFIRAVSDKLIFGEPNRVMYKVFEKYNIPHNRESLFDMMIKKSDLLLQSGTEGFEYCRTDLGRNIRFVGALLPYSAGGKKAPWYDKRLSQYKQVVLVTQGTVEKDVEKLIVPALDAFKDTDTLVVCTTGGSDTKELQARFPQRNLIIEDFIPFSEVMPYTDVYITNGGYGGVMLGIENKLPLVVAGIHEGKNEINARVEYFKLGINLRTERPRPKQLFKAVQEVLGNKIYKENTEVLAREFSEYQPVELCAAYIAPYLRSEKAAADRAVQVA